MFSLVKLTKKATVEIVDCLKFRDVSNIEKEEPVDREDWCNRRETTVSQKGNEVMRFWVYD